MIALALIAYLLVVGLVLAFMRGAAVVSAEPECNYPAQEPDDQLYDQELDTDDFRAWIAEVRA